jgi:hypothetical protein
MLAGLTWNEERTANDCLNPGTAKRVLELPARQYLGQQVLHPLAEVGVRSCALLEVIHAFASGRLEVTPLWRLRDAECVVQAAVVGSDKGHF